MELMDMMYKFSKLLEDIDYTLYKPEYWYIANNGFKDKTRYLDCNKIANYNYIESKYRMFIATYATPLTTEVVNSEVANTLEKYKQDVYAEQLSRMLKEYMEYIDVVKFAADNLMTQYNNFDPVSIDIDEISSTKKLIISTAEEPIEFIFQETSICDINEDRNDNILSDYINDNKKSTTKTLIFVTIKTSTPSAVEYNTVLDSSITHINKDKSDDLLLGTILRITNKAIVSSFKDILNTIISYSLISDLNITLAEIMSNKVKVMV
jgi:hypothetical protein